jgi:hypothetical protein
MLTHIYRPVDDLLQRFKVHLNEKKKCIYVESTLKYDFEGNNA